MMPIKSENDERMLYLKKILEWLVKWKEMKSKGYLSNETMCAMILTTQGFLKLQQYCFSQLKFSYLLPGKFQTDNLESRFGQYRQMAGEQYNISLRQLFEVEQKIRLQSSAALKIRSKTYGDIIVDEFSEAPSEPSDMVTEEYENKFQTALEINDEDIDNCNEDLPILVYLAGYCCHAILKQSECVACKEMIVIDESMCTADDAYKLIKDKNRGKLLYPQLFMINIVIHSYVVISKLCGVLESDFLKSENQRVLAHGIILKLTEDYELLWEPSVCSSGHTAGSICKKFVWISTNIFLNNYCKMKNDISKSTSVRKRTIFTHK